MRLRKGQLDIPTDILFDIHDRKEKLSTKFPQKHAIHSNKTRVRTNSTSVDTSSVWVLSLKQTLRQKSSELRSITQKMSGRHQFSHPDRHQIPISTQWVHEIHRSRQFKDTVALHKIYQKPSNWEKLNTTTSSNVNGLSTNTSKTSNKLKKFINV